MPRLLEALDRQAYREALRDVMDNLDRVSVDADREILSLFGDLRRKTQNILIELGDTPSGPLYRRTIEGLDTAITEWAERWGVMFERAQQEGFSVGEDLAARPLEAGLPDFQIARLGPTTDQLRILATYRADLVGGVTAELNKRIRNEVAGVLVGATDFTTAAKNIGRNLTDSNHFTTVMHRARAIMVTEIGRAQAIGTQATQERAAESVPTLRKRWLNAHLPDARATHIAAEARYHENGVVGPIPVDQPYAVAGFDAMYPHDPNLPARESVHCHCVSISVVVEPGAVPEPKDPAPGEDPLTDQDEERRDEDPELTPRELENRARFERLATPLAKPKGWAKMTKKKKLKWLEDQMEADFPLGEEWRDQVVIQRRRRVGVERRDGSPVINPRTGKQRTRLKTEFERVPKIKGSDLPTTFNFEGLDPDVLFPQMNELRVMARAFPEVAERLAYVGGYRGTKGLEWKIQTRWGSNTYAHASNDGRRLGLNPKFYSDPDLGALKRRDWKTGWSPVGDERATIVHEWGHHVENWLRRESGKTLIPVGQRADGFGHVGTIVSQLVNEFAAYSSISRYSLHSRAEGWAEVFNAWWYRKQNYTWTGDKGLTGQGGAPSIPDFDITGARPLKSATYGDDGERWLDRFGRLMDLLEGTRLADQPEFFDLEDFRSLDEAGRIAHAELRNQLIDSLGGELPSGGWSRLDIGLLSGQ